MIPEPEAWTGQRLPFFIELRAEGTFSGSSNFDLPEVNNTLIIKTGNPVLSSETKDGTEILVQRHEFALFSQSKGSLTLPPITARFSHKKGYTGPDFNASVKTRESELSIKRPPESEAIGFLVTTDSLEIEESWDPSPGPVQTGAVFKRTIRQTADQQSGIALKPAPLDSPDGVRVYADSPEVSDQTERGRFKGTRKDTITYLVQEAGLHKLPEIRYDWWNPETEALESKVLPSITFSATSPPPPPQKPSPLRFLWFIIPVVLVFLAFLYRRAIAIVVHELLQHLDPPPNRARRHFLAACRQNDAVVARRAWDKLRAFHPNTRLSEELKRELIQLLDREYGRTSSSQDWSGQALAHAYRVNFANRSSTRMSSSLPELNP